MILCWCTDTVIFAVGALLIVIQCSIKLKYAWRSCSQGSIINKQVLSQLKFGCVSLRAALQSLVNPTAKSGLDKLLEDKLELRRAAATHSLHLALANGLSVTLAAIMWNIAWDKPRWMTNLQVIPVLIGFAIVVVTSYMPSLNPRLREIVYGVQMILLAIYTGSSSPEYIQFSSTSAFLIRIILSFSHMKVGSAVIWNMVIVVANCVLESQNPLSNIPPGMLYIWEVLCTAILLFTVAEVRRWTLTAIRQDIDVSNLKMENKGCVSLLDMVCDVNVELSNNLSIMHDSRAFAALLMMSSCNSLTNVSFCNFICGDHEKDNFKNKLLAADAGIDAPVGTCRVSLSDSMRNPVKVEIFFVKVSTQDSDCRFLLGIREFTDSIPEIRSFQSQGTKRPRALANKGTPSDAEHVSFETSELSGSSSSVLGAARKQRNLRFPHLACTRLDAMCSEIMVDMTNWNIDARMTFCCTFHAYVSQLKEAYGMMSRTTCWDFPPRAPSGFQCQECGLFAGNPECDEEELECSFCTSRTFKFFEDPKISVVSM
eukprot:TRINITY_DN7741_c0_g1_i6.p1 TRINITY_DN7741_c0_g1~~TRINITY_DN7741_c0_g1_i6.p1  ORF type:complete len:555 (+),score=72.40 TRINITY_DN7741_c0_g1_i6:44-1666(+)